MDEKGKKMEELKRCPFCGGEVAIAETGDHLTSWMFITRGNGKNGCKCRAFMESKPYSFNCSAVDKEKIKKDLIEAWNKRYKEG